MAQPGLAWLGLAWLGLGKPGLAWPGLVGGWAGPGLAWLGLAWPGLTWLGLASPLSNNMPVTPAPRAQLLAPTLIPTLQSPPALRPT